MVKGDTTLAASTQICTVPTPSLTEKVRGEFGVTEGGSGGGDVVVGGVIVVAMVVGGIVVGDVAVGAVFKNHIGIYNN